MAASDINIKIKSTADLDALNKAEQKLETVANAAEKTSAKIQQSGSKSVGAFKKLGDGITRVQSIFEKFNAVFRLMGAIAAIQTVISAYQTLKELMEKAKKEAEELNRKMIDEKNEKLINAEAKAYKELSKEIENANRARKLEKDLKNQEEEKKRDFYDATLDMGEAEARAAINPKDPDAAKKTALISNDFAMRRAKITRQRAWEDRIYAQRELYGSRDENLANAEKVQQRADSQFELSGTFRTQRARLYNPWFTGRKSLDTMPEEKRTHWDKLIEQEEAAYKKYKELKAEAQKYRDAAKEDETRAAAMGNAEAPAVLKADATIKALETERKKIEAIENHADKVKREKAEKAAADALALEKENEKKKLEEAQKAHEKKIKLIEKECDIAVKAEQEKANAAKKAADDANNRIGKAQDDAAQANGWILNPKAMGEQRDAEEQAAKDEEFANTRYEKDLKQLQKRDDWRTAKNLSNAQEAARRRFLAEEEKAAAEQAAADAAADLQQALDDEKAARERAEEQREKEIEKLESIEKRLKELGL